MLTDVDKLLSKVIVASPSLARHLFDGWAHVYYDEPQVIQDDDEPYIFLLSDIAKNPEVIKPAPSLTSQTNQVYSITNKHQRWRRCDKVTGLWNPSRKQQIEKLRPTCSNS